MANNQVRKKEYNVPLIILSEQDLVWISAKLVEVDSLYPHFGLDLPEWTVLKKNNPYDYKNLKYEMLLCWRRKNGSEATLNNLVSALLAPESVDAKVIEQIIQYFTDRIKSNGKGCSYPVQASDGMDQQQAISNIESASDPNADHAPTKTTMDIILQLNPEMNKYINIVSLIPYLNKYGILTSDERFYLNNSSNLPTEKVTFLLQLLESKDDKTVQNFLKALKEASEHTGHKELCRLLKNEGVNI